MSGHTEVPPSGTRCLYFARNLCNNDSSAVDYGRGAIGKIRLPTADVPKETGEWNAW
jgi:hypothetical protein